MLNTEITAEARRIAHSWIGTCKGENLPNDAEYHTNHCNLLCLEIAGLAFAVKLAAQQRQPMHDHTPPPFHLEGSPADV
jgi:hypothetical protein